MSHRPYVGGRVQLRARPSVQGTVTGKYIALDGGIRYNLILDTGVKEPVEAVAKKYEIRPVR